MFENCLSNRSQVKTSRGASKLKKKNPSPEVSQITRLTKTDKTDKKARCDQSTTDQDRKWTENQQTEKIYPTSISKLTGKPEIYITYFL